MLNSFTIFLAFLGFLTFGYLSILRFLVKREFGNFSLSIVFDSIRDRRMLTSLGSSAFFISMPATSLLLFWGWAPAILWLIAFHLLVESLLHLQYTTTEQDHSLAELLVHSKSSKLALFDSALVQAFFILLMATVVSLLATLIDKQSGLLFALIALFPAQQLLRNRNASVPFLVSLISSAFVLTVGVLFAHKLGFGIYGNWLFFTNNIDWLRLNNVTLIAGVLIVSSFLLANKNQFQEDVATLSGGFIIFLIVVMSVRLGLLQPIMDAPLNAAQSASGKELNAIPNFISLCFFSFAGLGALLIRLLNDETNYSDAKSSASCFGRLQIESFVQLIFLIVLVLSLASALGIGAWKTHYTRWAIDGDFIAHLNLAINSTLQLVHSSVKTGTFAHTIIMVGMCVAGTSFLMMCVSRFKITRHNKGDDTNLLDVVMSNKVPQAVSIFLLSCYFIEHGITVSVWLIIGILSWALIVHLIIAITYDMDQPSIARMIYGAVSLSLVVVGSIQISWLSVRWFTHDQYWSASIATAVLLIGVLLWSKSLIKIVKRANRNNDEQLFAPK